MDYIDKFIQDIVSKPIYEPEKIENTIRSSLISKSVKSKTNIYKFITVFSAIIFAITSISYAGYYVVKNIFNNRKGFDTAIEHNYISIGTSEYIESNNISIKIDNSLMNAKNLDISFNILFDTIDISNYKNAEFEKILIVDNKQRILYSNNTNQLEKYIRDNNLDISIGNFNNHYFNSGASMKINNISKNNLNLIYNIVCSENYPESDGITVIAENIVLNEDGSSKILNGLWKITETFPEIFKENQTYKYSMTDTSEDEIVGVNLTVYNTEAELEIIMHNKVFSSDNLDPIEIIEELEKAKRDNNTKLIKDLEQKLINHDNTISNTFSNLYIKNSFEQEFKLSEIENPSNKTNENKNNIVFYGIFDLTTYDATKDLQLYFNYNNKDYIVNLNR